MHDCHSKSKRWVGKTTTVNLGDARLDSASLLIADMDHKQRNQLTWFRENQALEFMAPYFPEMTFLAE